MNGCFQWNRNRWRWRVIFGHFLKRIGLKIGLEFHCVLVFSHNLALKSLWNPHQKRQFDPRGHLVAIWSREKEKKPIREKKGGSKRRRQESPNHPAPCSSPLAVIFETAEPWPIQTEKSSGSPKKEHPHLTTIQNVSWPEFAKNHKNSLLDYDLDSWKFSMFAFNCIDVDTLIFKCGSTLPPRCVSRVLQTGCALHYEEPLRRHCLLILLPLLDTFLPCSNTPLFVVRHPIKQTLSLSLLDFKTLLIGLVNFVYVN